MINLQNYSYYIDELRNYAKHNNVRETELEKIFDECFDEIEKKLKKNKPGILSDNWRFVQISLILSFFLSILVVTVYYDPYPRSFFLRNIQNYIYPGFYIFRKLALPVITQYPLLTEYYDETCLVENPFFQLSSIDCWPCNTLRTIPDMTGLDWIIPRNFSIGFPFIRQEKNSTYDLSDLFEAISENKDVFATDAQKISSNNPDYQTIIEFIDKRFDTAKFKLGKTHITWRINRMKPGRILRKLFPKPSGTPDWWGPSVERFIFVDEPSAPVYNLPNPECSNVILRSTNGLRLIKMVPSPECISTCQPAAIILKAGYTLWYNWFYWRPISYPVINASEISVNHLTSFC